MPPWRDWYHVNGNTYGTWLPGDSRGWRARGHREHVDGDYTAPPTAGLYDGLHDAAEESLKKDAVLLSEHQRALAGQALVEMLVHSGVALNAVSVDRVHYHFLGQFTDLHVRRTVGRAKKHATFVLRDDGLAGTAWARRCRALPVTDRSHQVNVFRYITRHAAQGAWVWTFRDGITWPTTLRFAEGD